MSQHNFLFLHTPNSTWSRPRLLLTRSHQRSLLKGKLKWRHLSVQRLQSSYLIKKIYRNYIKIIIIQIKPFLEVISWNIDFVREKHIDRTRPKSTSFVCIPVCTCSWCTYIIYYKYMNKRVIYLLILFSLGQTKSLWWWNLHIFNGI